MKDQIVLNLPYPVKFLGVRFSRMRKIGFLFTNLSLFLFRENLSLKTSEDYNTWIKDNGEARMINEMLYASAMAYTLQFKKKQNYTKHGLTIAITQSTDEQQAELMAKWSQSQTFGAKVQEKKKKAAR